MRKLPVFVLLTLLALAIPAAWGQSATTKVRGAGSLPATCVPGDANTPADTIVVGNVPYVCTGPFTWSTAPWADITAFGARAPTGGMPTASANCTAKSNVIGSVTGASYGFHYGFNINDGVTLWGCGETEKMSMPSGLTVRPAGTWGLLGTESPLFTVAAGNTTYSYTVIASDIFGGMTIPATPVSISTGLASIGKQTAIIGKLTRTNDRITVVLKAAPASPLVAGDLVELEPKNGTQFAGWYNVAQVDSSTQVEFWNTSIDTRAQGWMTGDTTTYSGGGDLIYYRSNYLAWTPVKGAWMYYVCAKRSGDRDYHLIGMTKPSGPSGYLDDAFEDYGSPYMDKQAYPPYVETPAEAAYNDNPKNPTDTDRNAICTSSKTLNDPLSTWITGYNPANGNFTLHDAATNSVTGATMKWDDAPGIRRALAAAASQSPNYYGGAIYIPPSLHSYLVNSYIPVPNQVTIWQSGKLTLNETVSLAGNDNWFGDWSSQGTPQFGIMSGAAVSAPFGNPAVYIGVTGNTLRMLNIATNAINGGTQIVDDSSPSVFDLVNLGTGGASTDYVGMNVVLRGTGSIQQHFFNKVSFLTGPDQVNDKSWTPSFWIAPAQNYTNVGIEVTLDKTTWNRRGIGIGGGGVSGGAGGYAGTSGCGLAQFTSSWSYRQGGILPMVATMGCPAHTQITINDASQDTEGQPLLAAFSPGVYLGPRLTAHNPTGGATAPLTQGYRLSLADIDEAPESSARSFPNRDFLFKTSGTLNLVTAPYATSGSYGAANQSLYSIGMPLHGAGGYSWWFDLPMTTAVTARAANGGSVPAATYVYAVSAVGADNGETILSAASSPVTTRSGMQSVDVEWSHSIGPYSYNVWRCDMTNPCVSEDGTINVGTAWYRVALHVLPTNTCKAMAAPSYCDTSAAPMRYTPPTASGTGPTIMNSTGLYSPYFQAPPITVSQLPAAAAENAGQMRRVTDSTTVTSEGQTCAGGGSGVALAFSNGTVWKCF